MDRDTTNQINTIQGLTTQIAFTGCGTAFMVAAIIMFILAMWGITLATLVEVGSIHSTQNQILSILQANCTC